MKYVLMHKDIAVLQFELDEIVGGITKIGEIFDSNHLPVGVSIKHGLVDRSALNKWWRRRSIPASRDGLKDALDELGVSSAELLLHKCYGLSLSDQYWICPENSGIEWKDINFFDNNFSEDVGNILLGHSSDSDSMSFLSPDSTSDGWLKKKWSIIGGKRLLLKAGSNIYRQEPYNEVIASALLRRLGVPHVDYRLTTIKGEPYCSCENFITKETELVTCNHLTDSRKQLNNVSNYQHFVNCCSEVGLDAVPFLDRMLTVDFIIANIDRHTNNFGLIRNAETLEYIGFAPIYDSGSSLWFDTLSTHIMPLSPRLESKPFKGTHREQIKLVKSFDWLDFNALRDIDEEIREVFGNSEYIDIPRCDAICKAVKERINLLLEIAGKSSDSERRAAVNRTNDDIKTDIAYSGTPK